MIEKTSNWNAPRFDTIIDLISKIRKIKKEQNVNNNDQSELLIAGLNYMKIKDLESIIKKLGNVSEINQVKEKPKNTFCLARRGF